MAVSKYGVEIPQERPWLNNVVYTVVQGESMPPVPDILVERLEESCMKVLSLKRVKKKDMVISDAL